MHINGLIDLGIGISYMDNMEAYLHPIVYVLIRLLNVC